MFWYRILTCTCIWGCSILAGWHNKFNRQVRLDQPPTFMLIGELKEEAATVELELKEISAGFSTINKKHKYERVNRQWFRAWDRLDEDENYFIQILNSAYHQLPTVEDSERNETGVTFRPAVAEED